MNELKAARMAEMSEMIQINPMALNYELRSEATTQLKLLIHEIASKADLDEEKIAKRIQSAVKSPYGRIPGLLNLLTSIVLWPVEGKDFSGVAETQLEILDTLKIELELFLDIKESKGYHTFLNDDHEIVRGMSPDVEEYNMLCLILCQKLGIAVCDSKLNLAKWQEDETIAVEKAKLEQEEAELELARFKAMNVA